MNSKVYKGLILLKEQLLEAEKDFLEQQKELEITKLERDIYKEIIINTQNTYTGTNYSNVVYVPLYSRDNGEGMDTETCIGVFTTKTKALQAILDVCKKNKELCVKGFMINEFNVDIEVGTDDIVYVIQCDEEAHCEISTTILDVKCDNLMDDYKDCYNVKYTVDKVYSIE